MRKIGSFLVLAVLFSSSFPVTTSAGETRYEFAQDFRSSSLLSDPNIRKSVIDQSLSESSARIQFDEYQTSSVLKEADAIVLTMGARDAADIHVNPEPSSVLVWSAMVIGLLSAGYAYRRRLDSPADLRPAGAEA